MSEKINRIIKSAEKAVKFGDFNAARMTCFEGLETYPENPRLQALAKRLAKPQIAQKHREKEQGVSLPKTIADELKELSDSYDWLSLVKRCLELKDQYKKSPVLWNFLGCAYLKMGYPVLAESALRKSIENDPTYFAAYSNLGNALLDVEKFEEAVEVQQAAAKLNPFHAQTQNNLGAVYEAMARHEEAFECFTKAFSLDPDYKTAEYNLAAVNLRNQNFVEGWTQRESRWARETNDEWRPYLETLRPLWDGSHVERLYIWAEQGVGDEVMFASCFDDLKSRCNELYVSCSARLIKLFERSFGDSIQFVDSEQGLSDDQFDCHAPALTATGLVRRSAKDFKFAAKPYLYADPVAVQSIRRTIEQASGGKPIVGVSWLSKNKRVGLRRSIPLVELVAALPEDYFLINLQYGDVINDLREVEINLNRGVSTFNDIDNFSQLELFAALIAACDEIVSIDNSTVHFAGALGKKCHVLLPFSSDWRWGVQGKRKSYWYDSLSLHWQTEVNNWTDAIQSLQLNLTHNSPS